MHQNTRHPRCVINIDMKKLIISVSVILLLSACGRSAGRAEAEYSSEVCDELAVRIDSRDSLSQADYAEMIRQSEAIMAYLVDQSRRISEMPDSLRAHAWRELQADPEYLERFGYMFTLGSTLYQADSDGRLDKTNAADFADLDRYNAQLAEYSDRAN